MTFDAVPGLFISNKAVHNAASASKKLSPPQGKLHLGDDPDGGNITSNCNQSALLPASFTRPKSKPCRKLKPLPHPEQRPAEHGQQIPDPVLLRRTRIPGRM